MNRYAIILAAGKGTRMKSNHDELSKVSFEILGRPLVKWVIESLKPLNVSKIVTVVGFGGKTAEEIVKADSEVVWQHEQKGTGHAVMMASPKLEGKEGETIVCCGDTPLLKPETLAALFKNHEESGNALTVMTSIVENPFGYGRIEKKDGSVVRIVEQKDCTEEEKAIKEINAGVYVFDNAKLFEALKHITTNNAAGEYYLTDVLGIFVANGEKVGSFPVDFNETLGVNDRRQLAEAGKILRKRINDALMVSGVTIIDPDCTYIGPDVLIGQDTTVYPGAHIYGKTKIGSDCVIGPATVITNCEIGNGANISFATIEETSVKDGEAI